MNLINYLFFAFPIILSKDEPFFCIPPSSLALAGASLRWRRKNKTLLRLLQRWCNGRNILFFETSNAKYIFSLQYSLLFCIFCNICATCNICLVFSVYWVYSLTHTLELIAFSQFVHIHDEIDQLFLSQAANNTNNEWHESTRCVSHRSVLRNVWLFMLMRMWHARVFYLLEAHLDKFARIQCFKGVHCTSVDLCSLFISVLNDIQGISWKRDDEKTKSESIWRCSLLSPRYYCSCILLMQWILLRRFWQLGRHICRQAESSHISSM